MKIEYCLLLVAVILTDNQLPFLFAETANTTQKDHLYRKVQKLKEEVAEPLSIALNKQYHDRAKKGKVERYIIVI